MVSTTRNVPIVTVGNTLICTTTFSNLENITANVFIKQAATSNLENITEKSITNNKFTYKFPVSYDGEYSANIDLSIKNTNFKKTYLWNVQNFLDESNIYSFPTSLNWSSGAHPIDLKAENLYGNIIAMKVTGGDGIFSTNTESVIHTLTWNQILLQ